MLVPCSTVAPLIIQFRQFSTTQVFTTGTSRYLSIAVVHNCWLNFAGRNYVCKYDHLRIACADPADISGDWTWARFAAAPREPVTTEAAVGREAEGTSRVHHRWDFRRSRSRYSHRRNHEERSADGQHPTASWTGHRGRLLQGLNITQSPVLLFPEVINDVQTRVFFSGILKTSYFIIKHFRDMLTL